MRDRAGTRQLDHLGELLARAPVGEDHGRLERHGAEAHRERPARQPEHRDLPAGRDGARGERQRLVAADAVDDHGRAAAAGGARAAAPAARPDAGSTASAPLRAATSSASLAAVDGDDARRAERLQELDGDVAEAADADHDRARPRPQQVQRAADRVVRSQAGVGQRRRGHRVEPVERHGEARGGHDHVLREPAVAAEPGAARRPPAVAQVLGPDAAGAAAPASPRPVDEDRLAELEAVGSRAERGDGAGDLVAERERELVRQRAGAPVHQVQVRMAEPGAGDAHEHLTRTGFRLRHLDELGRLLPGREPNRPHAATVANELNSYQSRAMRPDCHVPSG